MEARERERVEEKKGTETLKGGGKEVEREMQ